MYGSLFWIEWLDRLDRVLTSIRMDLTTLSSTHSARSLAAMQRSTRQLSALTHDLELLDPSVIKAGGNAADVDQAGGLKKALETTLHHLGDLTDGKDADDSESSRQKIAAVAEALRDSRYEAAMLLEPRRRRA